MTTATAFWKNSLTWLVCSAVTSLHQSPGPSAAMPCHTQRAAGNCARFAVPVPFPLWEIPTFVRFSSSSLLLLDMASISSACCHSLACSTCMFVLAHCVNRPGYGPVGSTAQIYCQDSTISTRQVCEYPDSTISKEWQMIMTLNRKLLESRGKNRFASYEVHTGHFFLQCQWYC